MMIDLLMLQYLLRDFKITRRHATHIFRSKPIQKGGLIMDKMLRINMSAEGSPKVNVDQVGGYAGLGGRALTSAVVSKEVPPLYPSAG